MTAESGPARPDPSGGAGRPWPERVASELRAVGRLVAALAVIVALTLLAVPLAVRIGTGLEAVGFLGDFLGAGQAPWLAGRKIPLLTTRTLPGGGRADVWRPRSLQPYPG